MAENNDPPPKILQHVLFPEKLILKDDAKQKKTGKCFNKSGKTIANNTTVTILHGKTFVS